MLSLEYDQLPQQLKVWQDFLTRVSKVYSDNDQERYLMERSLEISSREMQERWQALNFEKAKSLNAEKFATLGEMAGGIAHEINNPIGLIGVLTSQIREIVEEEGEIDKDLLLESLRQVEESVWRVAKIIKSLRSFSRDGSNDDLVHTPVRKIIDDVAVFCKERFKQHNIRFTISDISDELMVNCRETEICQVLLNLLNNAFDAIEGMLEEWVELSVGEDEKYIYFAVTNSGPQISDEIQKKLFQPFFTTKEVGKGTGLGLSISRKIAESHGGSLVFDPSSEYSRFALKILK